MRRLIPLMFVLAGCASREESTTGAAPRPSHAELLIVTPAAFYPDLGPYIEHKSRQLRTRVLWLESVLASEKGADDAEKLKRRLYRHWREGARYVLLVGDADVLPVRYMTLDRVHAPAFDVAFYPSDLYYADVAKSDGSFENWNGARDGVHGHYWGEVHGEHHKTPPVNFDAIDYRPELAVGRWPVSTKEEVALLVKKSIDFEEGVRQSRAGLVVTGGWVDARAQFDGLAAALEGRETRKLYYETKEAPTVERLAALLNEGALVVAHAGHGDGSVWDGCLTTESLKGLKNADRLPILTSAGCSTALFATLPPYEGYVDVLGAEHPGTNAGEVFLAEPPPPACYQRGKHNSTGLGEQLLRGGENGAVAYFGCNTGSQPCGLTLVEEFVKGVARERRLGDAWIAAVNAYWEREKLGEIVPTEDWYPASIFFQGMKFMLFGDPSLRLPGP